jgi:hypothetical protein
MPNREPKKSCKFFAPKVFIRTFGWPYASALQCFVFVLQNSMNLRRRAWAGAPVSRVLPFGLRGRRPHLAPILNHVSKGITQCRSY